MINLITHVGEKADKTKGDRENKQKERVNKGIPKTFFLIFIYEIVMSVKISLGQRYEYRRFFQY